MKDFDNYRFRIEYGGTDSRDDLKKSEYERWIMF